MASGYVRVAPPLHIAKAGGREPRTLAQVADDRLVRARRRVVVGAGGASRHRVDAASRTGSRVVREDDGDCERIVDDRLPRADCRARSGGLEFPEELQEDQRPSRPHLRRYQPAHAAGELDRRQCELHHDVGTDGCAAGARDDCGRQPAVAAGGGAHGAAIERVQCVARGGTAGSRGGVRRDGVYSARGAHGGPVASQCRRRRGHAARATRVVRGAR